MALTFVQNDTLPQIKLIVLEEDNITPVDLTGYSVALHCKSAIGSSKFSREATFLNSTDRTNGTCYIQWLDGDLNRAAGDYLGEVELLSPYGRETIYTTIAFSIREDFGDIAPVSIEPV